MRRNNLGGRIQDHCQIAEPSSRPRQTIDAFGCEVTSKLLPPTDNLVNSVTFFCTEPVPMSPDEVNFCPVTSSDIYEHRFAWQWPPAPVLPLIIDALPAIAGWFIVKLIHENTILSHSLRLQEPVSTAARGAKVLRICVGLGSSFPVLCPRIEFHRVEFQDFIHVSRPVALQPCSKLFF